jgi:adenine phosphoribosyltransferase
MEQCRADRDTALRHPGACLLEGDVQPAAHGLSVERFVGRLQVAHPPSLPRPGGLLALSVCTGQSRAVTADRTYLATVGSQRIDLPLVQVATGISIALLICVDHGVRFAEKAGRELAEILAPLEVEIVASVATMGIPLAIEVTRALGLDDYAILHKTPKIHLADAVDEPVRSITTDRDQRLLFDRARRHVVEGRRVAIVDDVISTGGSSRAALNLVRKVGGEPVAFGALLTEGGLWRSALGTDAAMVHALGSIPLFHHNDDGSLVEDWGPTS